MRHDADVAVVGGGLGGLTCAALLAKAGLRVCLVEKNQRLGGYGATLESRGHRIDFATQALGGCQPDGHIGRVLAALGQEVRFLACEPARRYHFADGSVYAQAGTLDGQQREVTALWPEGAAILERYFQVLTGLHDELNVLSEAPRQAVFSFSARSPLLARYSGHTVAEFLAQLAIPQGIGQLLTARAGYNLLPVSRLSLVAFACAEASFAHGAWMVAGGIRQLGQALAQALRHHGGRIITGQRVDGLMAEAGRMLGVQGPGFALGAPRVVLAGAPRQLLTTGLHGASLPPAYLRRLARLEISGSYYIAYYSIPSQAAQGLHPNMEVRPGPQGLESCYLLIPSLVDPEAAPPGRQVLCLSVALPAGHSLDRQAAAHLGRSLEELACARFPSLCGGLERLFELTPQRLGAITANTDGAAYGWAQTPAQSGLGRLGVALPVKGLYLAGHWTMPGGGIAAVMSSGRLCAARLLEDTP